MKHRGSIAVVGIGTSGLSRSASETPISLAETAVTRALADANLERSDIDGLVVHIGSPRGMDYDRTASLLALDVRFSAQPWSHGRFAATVLQQGAMALSWGLADHVLCLASYSNSRFGRHGSKDRPNFNESLREGGGPHAENPHLGLTAPVAGAAMAAQRYFHRYDLSPDCLAPIALAFRQHARLNPGAVMQAPLTLEEYLSARQIVEPLRLFDCSVIVDGAVAVILSRADRAVDRPKPPVYLMGIQGIHAGPNEFIFGQPGLGIDQADTFDYKPQPEDETVYRMAEAGPADIDTLHVYDAFSPQVLWTLERFGFCDVGESAAWIKDGRIELGGALPVNTSGGHMSEGHFNGWGQIYEIVTQLRGEAGPRQVPNAKLAQWATTIGDSIIFGNDL